MIIVGLDLETTGLEQSRGHRIIEVAAMIYDVVIDPRGFPCASTLKGSWTKRINPQRPIDPGALAVHGITFEALAMEETWDSVAPLVARIMKASDVVVCHNGDGFDLPFISMELVRIGIAPVSVPSVDTMLQARWACPAGKLPRLGELCFATDVPYDKNLAHAAMYDVDCMMKAFFVGLRKGFFQLPASAS